MFSNAAATRRNRLNVIHLVRSLVLVILIGNTVSIPLEDFYPFSFDTDTATAELDDGGSEKLNLSIAFPFYNESYYHIYVNNNGIISFDDLLDTYKPLNFDHSDFKKETPPLVAPYWSDIDIQNVVGHNVTIRYRLTSDKNVTVQVDKDVRNNVIGIDKNFRAKLVLIVTWYNVGYYGATDDGRNKRNTFQSVLATDGTLSFAIFNYNKTVWTTGSNSNGNPETGLGGKPAVVGFYSGADGGYYVLDDSGTDDIRNISYRSNVGVPGKFIFKINDDIDDLSCTGRGEIEVEPKSVSMLGREVVRVSGPCFDKVESFKGRIAELELEFNCLVVGSSAGCVIPSLFRTGELTFEIDLYNEGWGSQTWMLSTTINSVHLLNMPTKLLRNKVEEWYAGNTVSSGWSNSSVPAQLEKTLNVLAYTVKDGKSSFETLTSLQVRRGETSRKFKLMSDFNNHSTLVTNLCWGDVDHPEILPRCIWSDVFPVQWKDANSRKSEQWCRNWLDQEKSMPPITINHQSCPCIEQIAQNDVGDFIVDPNCDNSSVNINCVYNRDAHKCFRRNNKGADHSGETCCYDNKGKLMDIRFSSGAGTYQRYHYRAQGEGIIPYFSYFESDLLPKLHCCQYSDDTDNCIEFVKYRNATMCQNYIPPSPAQACGDPHIVTLDDKGYSFNGIGNFYLVTDVNSSVIIQVHAEQAKDDKGELQNATVFTQVAMAMPGVSDTIEIKKKEDGLADVIVNQQIIPKTESSTSQQFNNISYNHKDDGSYLIVLEPLSVSITVEVTPDLLNIIVFIGEESLKGKLRGLLGNYNGKPEDDFIARNNTVLPDTINMRQIHFDFGMTWEVPENESILTANSDSSVDLSSDIVFQPVFIDEKTDMNLPNDTYLICGENEQCKFDYAVTQKKSIAESTAQFVSKFAAIKEQLDQKVVRCEYLDTPTNGNKTLTGFSEGDTATFTCNQNFELVQGTAIRTCQENNKWSGSDVVCAEKVVQEENDLVIIVSVTSSVGTVVFVGVCILILCIRRRRMKEANNSDDPQYDIPIATVSNIPVFENPVFMRMLEDTTSEGHFKIPRPNYVDPSIFQEYF